MNVKICMLGYGSIAQMHARALRQAGADLYSVAGRVPEASEAFAREQGFSHSEATLEAALADAAVDAVFVTSPSDLHAAHTEQALRAGKHVLCEIPLATNLRDADRLAELAASLDRRLMVGHTLRFLPAFVRAREAIAADRLHVHHIIFRYGFLRRENVNWLGRRRSWTDNLLWHHAGHTVDASLWLLGAAEATVHATLARPGEALGIPMDLSLALRTPRDQLVTIAMSYNTHQRLDDCLIIGEEDTYLVAAERLRGKEGVLYEPSPEGDMFTIAILAQDREFLAAVAEGREPTVSPRAVRPAMAALQAAQDQHDARLQSDIRHHVD